MNSFKKEAGIAFLTLVILIFGSYSFFHFSGVSTEPLAAQAISAMTFVVSKDGSGNYKTIQACADEVKPGQTCRVMAGVYDERVTPLKSGMSRSPISFIADGKVKVRGFKLDNRNFISVTGFEISNYSLTNDATAGISMESTNYITLSMNKIHDTGGDCIRMKSQYAANLSNYAVIKGNALYRCGTLNTSTPGAGVSIFGHGNLIEGNDMANLGEDFVQIFGGDNNSIKGNIFRDNTLGDWPGNNRGSIDGVQVECVINAAVPVHHLLIEDNTQSNSTSPTTRFINVQNSAGCESSDIIVRNNVVKDLTTYATLNDKKIKKLFFYKNNFADPTGLFSPAANTAGNQLTKVSPNDNGGQLLLVEDASLFQDGWGGIMPDYISVGTLDNVVQIKSINYSGNVITLASPIERTSGEGVWYFKYTGQPIPARPVKKTAFTVGSTDTTPPSTPLNLQSNLVLAEEVALVWDDSTDNVSLLGYKIYRDGVEVGSVRNKPYRDTSVQSNTIYTYGVTAIDSSNNESEISSLFQVTTPVLLNQAKTPPRRATAEPIVWPNRKPIPTPVFIAPEITVPVTIPQAPVYVPTPTPKPTETPYVPPPHSSKTVSVSSDPVPLPDLSTVATGDETPIVVERLSAKEFLKQTLTGYVDNLKSSFTKIFGK